MTRFGHSSGWSMETRVVWRGTQSNECEATRTLGECETPPLLPDGQSRLGVNFPAHVAAPVVRAALEDPIPLYWIWMTGARFSMWVRSIIRQWAGFLKMARNGHRLNRPVLIPESMQPRRMCCENQMAAIGCTIWSTDTQVDLAYPRVQMEDNGALSNSLWKTEMRSIYLWPWIWVGLVGLLQSHRCRLLVRMGIKARVTR